MDAPWTIAFYYVNPAWVALLICGIPIFVGAIKSLARKKITASVLISVAMLSAVILEIVGFFYQIDSSGHSHSYVFVAAEVAFLMAIGGAIEDFTVKKSRAGIERLVGLIPKEAFVKVENGLEKRPLEQIKIGDIVVVKAGQLKYPAIKNAKETTSFTILIILSRFAKSCCHSNMKNEQESCCLAEKEEEHTSCCCSGEKKQEKEECCHNTQNEEENCCRERTHKHEEKSCCHSHKEDAS